MSFDPRSAGRPVIRYRPCVPKPERKRPVSSRPSRPYEDDLRIVIDLPERPPVASVEIAVIETFLGEEIDALLALCHPQ